MGKLREYFLVDRTYLFDEDNVPAGAVLVAKHVAEKSAPAPANKARRVANK